MKYPRLTALFPGILVCVKNKQQHDKIKRDNIITFAAFAAFVVLLGAAVCIYLAIK